MKQSPRVALVGRFPPPFHGQAVSTQILATLLEERGLEVLRFDEDARSLGARPLRSRHGLKAQISDSWGYARLLCSLRREVASSDPDVIVYGSISATPHGHLRNIAALTLALPRSIPVIGTVHNGDVGLLAEMPILDRTWSWIGGRLHALAPLSPLLAQRLNSPGNIITIPNTLDAVFDDPPPSLDSRQASAREWDLRVLYLSNLLPAKGVFHALAAADLLAASGLKVRLEVVGAAPSQEVLERFRDRARASNGTVVYRGGIHDRQRLRAIYLESDVLLFPTQYRHEAQPMVILEALASGLPVIASPIGGIPDVVRHGETGYLVDPTDYPGMAAHLERIADEGARWEFGQRARADYEARYSRRVVSDLWVNAIQAAVSPA